MRRSSDFPLVAISAVLGLHINDQTPRSLDLPAETRNGKITCARCGREFATESGHDNHVRNYHAITPNDAMPGHDK